MFRLSFLLWLIVLAALNLVVLRFFDTLTGEPEPIILIAGLMPMFDVFLVAVYFILNKRFRFSIQRRSGYLLETFGATMGMILALATFLFLAAPTCVLNGLDMLVMPSVEELRSLTQSNHLPGYLIGGVLCAMISGPLIALAIIASLALSRFKLVVTRREGA